MAPAQINYKVPSKLDVENIIYKLPASDKVKLLAGEDRWHTYTIPEHGIPGLRVSDGPNGIRGTRMFNGVPSSCFPCATGLAASFDLDLAEEVGSALADECIAKGVHVLLGPTVNVLRSPLGGRGFESFSPDPYVNGMFAARYIVGVQAKGVAACIKHYVGNEQEFERKSTDSIIGERALREIYLKPFQMAVKHSNPWTFMTSYQQVNGEHVADSNFFLNDVLRKEWGWDGAVISDWTGVYTTAASIKAGCDLEMPGPSVIRGAAALRSMVGRKLTVDDLDKCVRRILNLVNIAIDSNIPFNAPEAGIDTQELRSLLRRTAADSIVLLKNDDAILPITTPKRIAVIGPNARLAYTSGGGAASLLESWTVSPLQGITQAAKKIGAEVKYTLGTRGVKVLPLLDANLSVDKVLGEWWNKKPSDDFFSDRAGVELPEAEWSTRSQTTRNWCIDGVDADIVQPMSYQRWTFTFIPDTSGDWLFGAFTAGFGLVFFDGHLIIDHYNNAQIGPNFMGKATEEERALVKNLQAGKEYKVEVRGTADIPFFQGDNFAPKGGFRLGGECVVDEEEEMEKAVRLARDSDVTVVVVGLNQDWESEGWDRDDLTLPLRTNELVSRILKADPRAVIINQSGTPVEMPWANDAKAILQAFYGGNELGNGIADVVFGKVNPSARLTMTFPKRMEDSPSFPAFSTRSEGYNKCFYTEGIYVDYRGHDIKKVDPLFAFAHGLSYTSFSTSTLSASPISASGTFEVTVTVQNTGKVVGREVILVYIHDVVSKLPRPPRELKAFAKTKELQPGEEETVVLSLDRDALGYWSDEKHAWVAEAGLFQVLVGGEKIEIELAKTIQWTGV
ncbi:glycoside hydrolase family 3 protein [Pterulicium gracile]|uniref:beta-glucosidase n=1 Tax=Pterulicium gracile TaxID=1884261 RepID=A0A5C3QQC0_9AGAR|nr:glycoside hydrolase family 3 protein [Pterula gracilis]